MRQMLSLADPKMGMWSLRTEGNDAYTLEAET
jgi:hypothetical protein